MKSAAALALRLQKTGITLFQDGENIRYRTRSTAPIKVIMGEVYERRHALIRYLYARDAVDFPPVERHDGSPLPSITQELWWRWINPATSLTLSLIEMIKHHSTTQVTDAIRAVVASHDTLRSRFSEQNGILAVNFNAATDFEVETKTLSSSVGPESLKAHIDEFVARPLRAGASWLIRATVFAIPDKGHVAVIVANHMVVDGTSIDIIRADLRRHFARLGQPQSIRQNLSYVDFAAWQRKYLARSGGALSEYWRDWSKNQTELQSPVGKLPMRWRSGKKVRRTFAIPTFAHSALVKFARENSTFPFMVYTTLLAFAVFRWSGQRSFPLRSICDLRSLPGLVATVGLMTGADAFSVDLVPEQGFLGNLKEIEEEYHAASRLRLPNIYALPPFAVGPALESEGGQRYNVGIVINYRKLGSRLSKPSHEQEVWPPFEGVPRRDVWSHDVSPVCLELTDLGEQATAAFLLHEDILSVAEQDGLIQALFAVFQETILQSNEIAK